MRSGSEILLWNYHGGDNQLWKIDIDYRWGSYIIKSKKNEEFVISDDSQESKLVIKRYNGRGYNLDQRVNLDDCSDGDVVKEYWF